MKLKLLSKLTRQMGSGARKSGAMGSRQQAGPAAGSAAAIQKEEQEEELPGGALVPTLSDEQVKEVFALVDGNGCGLVGKFELRKALKDQPRLRELLRLPANIKRGDGSQARFDALFKQMDADDSVQPPPAAVPKPPVHSLPHWRPSHQPTPRRSPQGKVTLKEFQAVLGLPKRSRDELVELFNLVDNNSCGLVGKYELRKALQSNERVRVLFGLPATLKKGDGSQDRFTAIFSSIDTDSSGKVTLNEFIAKFGDAEAQAPAAAAPSAAA